MSTKLSYFKVSFRGGATFCVRADSADSAIRFAANRAGCIVEPFSPRVEVGVDLIEDMLNHLELQPDFINGQSSLDLKKKLKKLVENSEKYY